MLVYRIATNEFVHDLSGYGAKLNGGRWNREGVAVLYTGSSIALCAWEYWVHLPDTVTLKQNAFSVATIQIPDHSVLKIAPKLSAQLQGQDNSRLHALTDDWIERNEHLVMQVPSAIIEQESNYLINPAHPLFTEAVLESVNPFSFDKRAFGKVLLK
ncbi:RES family NAD+ phosphorylase [Spirosoma soli]|uniref:RES family NAD+ phosphorylase n=1 Tax=Spirosoma soli TaxID=1770529 RepID=A0ABW5MB32_9BACT